MPPGVEGESCIQRGKRDIASELNPAENMFS